MMRGKENTIGASAGEGSNSEAMWPAGGGGGGGRGGGGAAGRGGGEPASSRAATASPVRVEELLETLVCESAPSDTLLVYGVP
ncbi:unnamed protein product [Danaus chrysippus]|uniref:(African queen) hypothetical protein n=1 Tax=Danaus chrysippus TaxID=151541 RepID=A0A8J2QI53_9NEOP|nr:unnamed protein product [Danaus chrysippus]